MSIKDDLKLRLSEEINFNGDGYNIMCGIIDDFFESKLHSHNTERDVIRSTNPCQYCDHYLSKRQSFCQACVGYNVFDGRELTPVS